MYGSSRCCWKHVIARPNYSITECSKGVSKMLQEMSAGPHQANQLGDAHKLGAADCRAAAVAGQEVEGDGRDDVQRVAAQVENQSKV